jgi:hypothetical protein
MKLRPRLDQALLPPRKRPCDQLHRVQAEHTDIFLILGVKVRRVMGLANLHIHSHDDSEESAEFRHFAIIPPPRTKAKRR